MRREKNGDLKNKVRIGDRWHEPVSFTVTVVKDGGCRANHKVGQKFIFDWVTPQGLCGESYVGMYPLLEALRVGGDMRELGSSQRNARVYNCPSRVVQFHLEATYTCNLCGNVLAIKNGEIQYRVRENADQNLRVRLCGQCDGKLKGKELIW